MAAGATDGDVLVVTQKVVSKAEDRLVADRPRRSAEPQAPRRAGIGAHPAPPRRADHQRDRATGSCAPTPASTCQQRRARATPRSCPVDSDRSARRIRARARALARHHGGRDRERHLRSHVAPGGHRRRHRLRRHPPGRRPAGHHRRPRPRAPRHRGRRRRRDQRGRRPGAGQGHRPARRHRAGHRPHAGSPTTTRSSGSSPTWCASPTRTCSAEQGSDQTTKPASSKRKRKAAIEPAAHRRARSVGVVGEAAGDPGVGQPLDLVVERVARRHVVERRRRRRGERRAVGGAVEERGHRPTAHRQGGPEGVVGEAAGDPGARQPLDLLVEHVARRHVVERRRRPAG